MIDESWFFIYHKTTFYDDTVFNPALIMGIMDSLKKITVHFNTLINSNVLKIHIKHALQFGWISLCYESHDLIKYVNRLCTVQFFILVPPLYFHLSKSF